MTVIIVAEGPSFRIIDDAAEQTVATRREEKENQAEETEAADTVLADKRNKIYYPTGCLGAKGIKEADRVTFETVADAERAGYKAAKNCSE